MGIGARRLSSLTILLLLFILAMAIGSAVVRDGESAQPLGYLFGVITFAVCTIASKRWETIYRRQLACGGER